MDSIAKRTWPILAACPNWDARFAAKMQRRRITSYVYEFMRFGLKEAWACLFGGLLLLCIAATRFWYPLGAPIARYDMLVMAALVIQALLLLFRLETISEAKVILIFHIVGTAMEVFKTAVGSWHYPEAGVLKIGHVPLFTGFMYAAIGSYLFRVWRLFDLRFTAHPPLAALVSLSIAIYANFFLDHWGLDIRFGLVAAMAFLFRRTIVYFRVWTVERSMPLLLGFALITLFIWLGENIGTAGGAWVYPNQVNGWTMVAPSKLVSWLLLMLISYTLVALAMRSRLARAAPAPRTDGAAI